MRNKTSVTLVAASLALLVGNAAAVPYTFTNLADTNNGTFRDIAGPSLNNSGTVAVAVGSYSGERHTFTGSDAPTTTLYHSSGSPNGNALVPSLSQRQRHAEVPHRLDRDNPRVFTVSDDSITTIADSNGPLDFQYTFDPYGPSLNNNGTVAFSVLLDTGETGIFTGNGGSITTIADSSGPFAFDYAGYIMPFINDSGTVAFSAVLDTGETGIFTGNGGSITTLYDTSGPFQGFYAFSLNDSGSVAFNASLDTGEYGIFTGSGGRFTTIADNSGPFEFLYGGSLNNSGTVAFSAQLKTGENGIFIGPDPLTDEVIRSGDTLFGSTVTELYMYRESLNDTGQIAFFYALDDGRVGVARADPDVTPIPEPGTLILLVSGLLGAVLWRKGRLA